MTISDDLRAAVAALDGLVLAYELPRAAIDEVFALTVRLNAHADTIERVEEEMREWSRGPEGADWMVRCANALRGDKP